MDFKHIKTEYKAFDFAISSEPIELGKGEWIIRGYASMRNIDNGGDRLIKGAFLDSIKERFTDQKAKNGKSKIKVLWQHQAEWIIGQLLEAYEDDQGLFVSIKLIQHPRFGHAERAYVLAQLGEIDSFSIGYKVLEDKEVYENGRKIRELIRVKFYEISLVTFPMNELAEFTQVKDEENMNEKILEAIQSLTAEVSLALKALATPVAPVEEATVIEEVKTEETVVEVPEVKKADDLVLEIKFDTAEMTSVLTKFHDDIISEVKSLLEEKAMMKCKDCGASMECKKCNKSHDEVMDTIDPTSACEEKKAEETIKEYEENTVFDLPEVVEAGEELKNNSNPENAEEDFLDFLLTKDFKF